MMTTLSLFLSPLYSNQFSPWAVVLTKKELAEKFRFIFLLMLILAGLKKDRFG